MNKHQEHWKSLPKDAQAFIKKIRTRVGKTIKQHGLISRGDRVLAGFSGGTDSLAMLEMLAERRKRMRINYEVHALHVNIETIPYRLNTDQAKAFCNAHDIVFHEHSEAITIDSGSNNTCFICSWNRRRILFEYARHINANKVALGHHKDDAIETLLMNMFFNGTMSALPANLHMFEGRVRLIRPLLEITGEAVKRYAAAHGFELSGESCPFEDQNKREMMKEILSKLEAHDPNVRHSLFQAMSNIHSDHLA